MAVLLCCLLYPTCAALDPSQAEADRDDESAPDDGGDGEDG
ncbi:hypothetical protein [Streptomyces sp. NRRL S-474]|nr:hypothetical protein [Streptomyces sp. NRRL S-474]